MQYEEILNGRTVLVTGGAGFVGSTIVRRLVDVGAKVTVLDDLFTGQLESIPSEVKFVEGSVCSPSVVEPLVQESEFVVHAAARNIIASTKDPRKDYEANIGGTLNVLLAARGNKKIKRIVYTSSASVYGNPKYLPIHEEEGVSPLSPYAVSKLAGENYCLAFYESYGIPVSVVRYSNVYGPGQVSTNPYCGVVSKFLESLTKGSPIRIHGDGEQTRDFTFVDDAVDGTLVALTSSRAEGEVFNLGTGVETSVNKLAGIIQNLFGTEHQVVNVDRRDIDNIRRRVVNIEKIRKQLRWVPRVRLDIGLTRTVDWYRKVFPGRND